MKKKISPATVESPITIKPPKFGRASFEITGIGPYVQLRFSQKAKNTMIENMIEGGNKRRKKRDPRDFDSEFPQTMYCSIQGWRGIPATAFRNALISACRLVNFKMTLAKLSIFVEADGYDADDATPLVRIYGEPESYLSPVRNANGGTDLRTRAMWKSWKAVVRIRYDEDQFNIQDVTNLLARVGLQVGLGEGRPDSRGSNGLGFGLFELKEKSK